MRDAAAQRADPAKPTRKKVYSANILFTDLFGGSASVPARAGSQKRFCANCKHVLRAGKMRGLLELL